MKKSDTKSARLPDGRVADGRGPQKGEGGRPPSEIRKQLRGSFSERIAFLNSVIEGVPMMRIRMGLTSIVPHCICANCGESEVRISDPANAILEVDVLASASVGDRIRAMDLLAKYGLGTSNEEKIEVRDGDTLPTAAERRTRTMTLLKRA